MLASHHDVRTCTLGWLIGSQMWCFDLMALAKHILIIACLISDLSGVIWGKCECYVLRFYYWRDSESSSHFCPVLHNYHIAILLSLILLTCCSEILIYGLYMFDQEKERESWEAACQALRTKLEASESACLCSEIEAAKMRSIFLSNRQLIFYWCSISCIILVLYRSIGTRIIYATSIIKCKRCWVNSCERWGTNVYASYHSVEYILMPSKLCRSFVTLYLFFSGWSFFFLFC